MSLSLDTAHPHLLNGAASHVRADVPLHIHALTEVANLALVRQTLARYLNKYKPDLTPQYQEVMCLAGDILFQIIDKELEEALELCKAQRK